MIEGNTCPLCGSAGGLDYHRDKRRQYIQCPTCQLVFVPSKYHLSQEQEKAEYDKHQNNFEDQGYLKFLSRTFDAVDERISPNSSGLDFGCGPAPVLAKAMSDLGHNMHCYDLYYHPDTSVLNQKYDFVTCTEVIEHLAQPKQIFGQLINLLTEDGLLAVMTKLVIDQQRFTTWHYKNDPTHISFFSKETFSYLAEQFNLSVEFVANDVVIFTKNQ